VSGQQVTVNSRKYDLNIRRSWKCELVEQNASYLIFVGEFDEAVSHPGLGDIQRGTVSYEYYWPGRWYNVFRFHSPDGEFRNYYCNISMPPTFENNVLDYVDLDIDIVVAKDFSYEILDRDDFEINTLKYGYPEALRAKIEETVSQLVMQIVNRSFPFDYVINP